MKNIVLGLSFLLMSNVYAKTFCTMTFNSHDEKHVFNNHLIPQGFKHVELIPNNKDPHWFKKVCEEKVKCDILLVSGHFGGLFFGEQISSILSLNELLSARENNACEDFLNSPRAVYLMGCNTMSGKTPDHRSVNDYLKVLVGDGFPLNLAQEVAASRYLNFGQSMIESMSSIFNQSQMLVGFESTGPLGKQAAPRLERAFKKTTIEDKNKTALNAKFLMSEFKGTNLRIIDPNATRMDVLKKEALSKNAVNAEKAWREILLPKNILSHYDFIIRNQDNTVLNQLLKTDHVVLNNIAAKFGEIYQQSFGLSAIQLKVLEFGKRHQMINHYSYQDSVINITKSLLKRPIDYIQADQLCSLFKQNKELQIFNSLTMTEKGKIFESDYANFLVECTTGPIPTSLNTSFYRCITDPKKDNWSCLIQHEDQLNIDGCRLAKKDVKDPEASDDMMWFCYDKMLNRKQLTKEMCIQMTYEFSIFGNQIKMNWNCLNRL